MDKADVARFLKEQRRKTEEASYKDSEKRRSSSTRQREEPYEEPSNTIMIRGLPSSITEDDIRVSLDDMRANYIAVRLIKDRRNGTNKGIAFVEFIAVNDARDLMDESRGELNISGYYGKLTYGYNVKEEVDRYDAEKTNSWKHEKPTNTVMLRGVSNMLSDNEVRAYITDVTKHVVDVRLIRDKKTGMSRGFGFVEFDSIAEAQRWMEYQQGYFSIEDVEMKLTYTSTRQGGIQMSDYFTTDVGDWSCARCGGHNFKRRDFCYKCHLSKSQSKSVMETIDGKDQIGSSPCNTLIMRDLDALTLEEGIVRALKTQFNSNVKHCEIMRDDVTKVSRCFAFVELASLSDSRRIVEYYEDNPDRVFELSGKAVTIDYARNTFSTLMTSYKEALAKRFEETYEPPPHETSNYDANAAAAVTQAALNQKKMHKKGAAASTVLPANVTVDGKSTESAMCFELIVNGQRCTSVPTNPFSMDSLPSSKFITPDTSKFLYDQSTQYYFDPVTGLYYDTNSQYFFDRMSQKYLYWDANRSTFVPVDTVAKVEDNTEQAKPGQKEGKKSKASEAKKIAKAMERWEKQMNSKKGSQSSMVRRVDGPEGPHVTPDTGGYSMFSVPCDRTAPGAMSTVVAAPAEEDLVAAYQSGGDSDDDVMVTGTSPPPTGSSGARSCQSPLSRMVKEEEERLLSWEKVACHLCNRGFKDRATLEKHRAVSDLHRSNLADLRERLAAARTPSNQGPSSSASSQGHSLSGGNHGPGGKIKYRDRAKERREKFGVPSPPSVSASMGSCHGSKRRHEDDRHQDHYQDYQQQEIQEETEVAVTSEEAIPGENIGSRLMAKMGWQAGQGLGRCNQGRTEVVQAEFVARGAGIGAAPKMTGTPSDNYRENLKRAMYAKYHDS